MGIYGNAAGNPQAAVNRLKDDLGSGAAGKGVSLVAGSIRHVENRLALINSPTSRPVQVSGFYGGTDTADGYFNWDEDRDKADANGGTIIDPETTGGFDGTTSTLAAFLAAQGTGVGTGCWVLKKVGNEVTVATYGIIDDGVTDFTSAYAKLAESESAGTKVKFTGEGTYLGNFIAYKGLHIDFGSATITPTDDNEKVVYIGGVPANRSTYTVIESTLNHGDIQFSVSGASTLFSVGDIGILHDGAQRPSDSSPVNFEAIKIKAIAGDVITVEGFIRSHFGVSTIVFQHYSDQVKDGSVTGGNFVVPATHVQPIVFLQGENMDASDIEVRGQRGEAVRFNECYRVSATKIRPRDPQAAGDHGVGVFKTTDFRIENVRGFGNLHTVITDSAYVGYVEDCDEAESTGVPFDFAHNGFGGYLTLKTLRARLTTSHPVDFVDQGFGTGALNAKRENHPFREVRIDGVEAVYTDAVNPDDSHVAGVYLRNTTVNCSIKNISARHESTAPLTALGSYLVRIDGLALGTLDIENISADRVGVMVFSNGNYGTGSPKVGYVRIRGFNAEAAGRIAHFQGKHNLDVDQGRIDSPLGAFSLVFVEAAAGRGPASLSVGGRILYGGSKVQLYEADTALRLEGHVEPSSRNIAASISVVASQVITATEIQNAARKLELTAPVGSGTTILGQPDAPQTEGEILTIMGWHSGRDDLEIPAGANWFATTIFTASEPHMKFIGVSGKWQRIL